MQLIKKWLKDLTNRNYYTAKAYWKQGQRKEMLAYDSQPIINYQMGKVGSSTVQASLEALDLNNPVYHVHFLNPDRVQEIEQQRRSFFRTEKHSLLFRPWLSEFLYEQIQKKDRHWKLISLVREPISRNISTFFENLEVTKTGNTEEYSIKSDYYGFEIDVTLKDVDPLIEMFFDRLVHERPLRYFDDEIRTVFGIDVFEGRFPREKGYRIYHGDNSDLLLIRLDFLNQCASIAIKEFLEINGFTLIQTNIGSEKIYAPLYNEVKHRIRLPEEYLEKMYTSKFTNYFYSDDEILQFRRRWSV